MRLTIWRQIQVEEQLKFYRFQAVVSAVRLLYLYPEGAHKILSFFDRHTTTRATSRAKPPIRRTGLSTSKRVSITFSNEIVRNTLSLNLMHSSNPYFDYLCGYWFYLCKV